MEELEKAIREFNSFAPGNTLACGCCLNMIYLKILLTRYYMEEISQPLTTVFPVSKKVNSYNDSKALANCVKSKTYVSEIRT